MKNQRKHLLFLTLLLSIMVAISSMLPLYATGEEIPTTEEPTTEVTPTETPLTEESGENTPLPTEETTPTTVEEVPPTESAQPTPTEETLPSEEPVVEVKQLDLSEHLVGLEEETYHTSIQFGNEETGLIQYEKELDKYAVTGFNADEINVSLNLHWNISEEVNIDEYDSAIYHLPENIAWDGDTITVYDLEDQPLELNEVATLEESTLTLKSFEVKHISINGTIAALELEEPETIVEEAVVEEKAEEVPTEETENLEEEPKEIVEEEKVIEKVTDIFTFSGIGQVDLERTKEHTIVKNMMMLRGPLLGNGNNDPRPVASNIDLANHLRGQNDAVSGQYTYIQFGEPGSAHSQLFILPRGGQPFPNREEIDKFDGSDDSPDGKRRIIDVFLTWNIDLKTLKDSEGQDVQIDKNTEFYYDLPASINWDPITEAQSIIPNLKNPSEQIGTARIEGNKLVVTYTERFIKEAYDSPAKTFTTFFGIDGKIFESEWENTGEDDFIFEGIGKFNFDPEDKTASLKVSKAVIPNSARYQGNGIYLIRYRSVVTANYKDSEGNPLQMNNVHIKDSYDKDYLSKPNSANATVTPAGGKGNCDNPTFNESDKTFACTLDYVKDGEPVTLEYDLLLDLNAILPTKNIDKDDPDYQSALSTALRTFNNTIEVEATVPNVGTFTDTSVAKETYEMNNPIKVGSRDEELPQNVNWVIDYNTGYFKGTGRVPVLPGIDLSGLYVEDLIGPQQKVIEGTFKILTSKTYSPDLSEWTDVTSDFDVNWSKQNPDEDEFNNKFSFTIPDKDYAKDFIRIIYQSTSTNQNHSVTLTNTASIASDEENSKNDKKTGSGSENGIGPGTLPKVSKKGDELGPNGNFEWTSDITFYEDFSRDVRYYDAMEQDLIVYPDTIKIQRVIKRHATQEEIEDRSIKKYYQLKFGDFTTTAPTDQTIGQYKSDTPYVEELKEELQRGTDWEFRGNTTASDQHTYDRKNPGAENNPPWLKDTLTDDSYDWYIELISRDANNIFPVDGYVFIDEDTREDDDKRVVYRITYQTNAPMPVVDEQGNVSKDKHRNESQIRVKANDTSDPDDKYNSADAELEKKIIEKAFNNNTYRTITGETVDDAHGYMGWVVTVYPLEVSEFVEIRDDFTYSSDKTTMSLVDGSVHVYVKNDDTIPSPSDEISSRLYTISNSSTSGFTLRINNPTAAGITKNSFIFLVYQTRANPKTNKTSLTYINTAHLNRGGDEKYPPATARTTRNDKIINKTSSRNGSLVYYTMEINKEKYRINPPSGVLTITDTRGESIEYVEGSMKFYDGENDPSCTTPLTGSPFDVISSGNTLTIKVPDERFIIIKYQASITKKDGELEAEEATNRAKIEGNFDFSDSNIIRGKVQNARSGGVIDTTHPNIKIVKANPSSRPLSGAEFKVSTYEIDVETGELHLNSDRVYTGFVSDVNGEVVIKNQTDEEIYIEYEKVYKIEEIKAPTGYLINKDAVFYILFTDHPEEYEEIGVFTVDGKPVEVIIESVHLLYRFDVIDELEPTPTPTPKHNKVIVPVPDTGDTFHVGMWIALLGGTVVIILFLLFYLRKNNKKD